MSGAVGARVASQGTTWSACTVQGRFREDDCVAESVEPISCRDTASGVKNIGINKQTSNAALRVGDGGAADRQALWKPG